MVLRGIREVYMYVCMHMYV